uniref:Uncharacterized protein n=1 Tax=Amphimedon queenslandica TaxID=400682 RepID=A0A1X7UNL4_AMPQE
THSKVIIIKLEIPVYSSEGTDTSPHHIL